MDKKVVALSLGITTSIVYIICLALVAILPLQTIVAYTNYMVHGLDVSSIAAKNITFLGAIIGLVEAFLTSAIIGYVFAMVYNWFAD